MQQYEVAFSNSRVNLTVRHCNLFPDGWFSLLLFWSILSPLMTINTRWHLRLRYQNTNPAHLSQNNIWQVKDPGASSHLLLGSAHVSANVLYNESKLTVKSVKSSLPPLQSPPAQVTHLVFMETTFNTPSRGAVASLFHYVSTSEGQDAVFLPPPLTDTVVMSNDSCQGSEGASKWTDTGSVKTPRTKSTDNIIILRTLYRMMRPGESMWLMHGTLHIIPHVLFKTVAQRACCDCCHLERCCCCIMLFSYAFSVLPYTEEIRALQEVKRGPTSCPALVVVI